MPRNVPSFDHSGLALRTFHRSRADVAVAPGLVVARELVVGAALRQRLGDMLGRQHAGQDGVVAALDARHVDEARRAADQRAARERQLRHRLIAALGDGARAIGQPLAALEGAADRRMGLEALEFLERRQIRIRVVEMDDEADRHQIVVEVIEERAAAGANCRAASRTSAAPGPACACPARPARAPSGRGRISAARGPRSRPYFAISCFDRLPRAPSANSVYLARSSMPRVKSPRGLPSLPMPMSPVATPATAPFVDTALRPRRSPDRFRRRAPRPWWRASGRRCRARRCSCRGSTSAAAS